MTTNTIGDLAGKIVEVVNSEEHAQRAGLRQRARCEMRML